MKAFCGLIIASSIVMSGCASKEKRQIASGSFQYLEASQVQLVEIPEGLDKPKFSNVYALPILSSDIANPLYGQNVNVTSPRLVLPLVSGSHVEEGSEDAKVMFDQINDDEPLNQTIWNAVIAFLEKNNIGVDEFNRENNTLTTDWVVHTEVMRSGWLGLSSIEEEDARKYIFSLTMAPHGRTGALSLELSDFIDSSGNRAMNNIDSFSLRNDTTEFLNQVIAGYDLDLRIEQSERIAEIRRGFATNLGFDSNGESALVVEAVYANTWPRLLLVLRKMGFDVTDLDQSSGLLFVQFNGEEDSWWGSLFGSGDKLELEQTEYRLKVSPMSNKTAVTFFDNENNALTVDKITQVYELFSDYMATEDLDI